MLVLLRYLCAALKYVSWYFNVCKRSERKGGNKFICIDFSTEIVPVCVSIGFRVVVYTSSMGRVTASLCFCAKSEQPICAKGVHLYI